MSKYKSCRECTLPVTPYKGDVEQVDEDLCEACFLSGAVPMNFEPKRKRKVKSSIKTEYSEFTKEQYEYLKERI